MSATGRRREAVPRLTRAAVTLAVLLITVATAGPLGAGCAAARRDEARREVDRELARRDRDRREADRAFELARKAYEAGDLDEARTLLAEAARSDPDALHVITLLGQVEFDRGRLFEAASAFDRAAKLAPTRHEPRYNLGLVLEHADRLDEAIDAYEAALAMSPGQVEVMENLARAYIRTGRDPRRARELVDQALLSERRPEWRRWLSLQSIRLAEAEAAAAGSSHPGHAPGPAASQRHAVPPPPSSNGAAREPALPGAPPADDRAPPAGGRGEPDRAGAEADTRGCGGEP